MKAKKPDNKNELANDAKSTATNKVPSSPKEIGGRKDGLDPTRYGDWEKNGRCIDF